MTTPTPDQWAITVRIPDDPAIDRDALFHAVADTAHRWEPPVRDGWDVDVSGGPVAPCPYVVTGDEGTSHCTLAESCADGGTHRGAVLSLRHQRDALAAEVAALRTIVRDLGGGGQEPDEAEAARKLASAWAAAWGWPSPTADAACRALTEDTPDTPPVCATCNDTRTVTPMIGAAFPCPDCTEDTHHAE